VMVQPEAEQPTVSNAFLTTFYPESRFGGFADGDSTVAFYVRVHALLKPDSHVVDFGCGTGSWGQDPVWMRRDLRTLKGKVRKVVGLDVDPAAANNPFIDEFFLVRDSWNWPLPSRSVDAIVCDSVLEHVEQPDAFFSEASRVLKLGGWLCIRTPNVLSYFGILSRLVPTRWRATVLAWAQPTRRAESVFPALYRCNTVWRLRKALSKYGFDAVVWGYEGDPAYLSFWRAAYACGVLHARYAPRFCRVELFAFGRLAEKQAGLFG